MAHEIVRLDHCQTYYGWAGPLWNFMEDITGWLALTVSGEVKLFGNGGASNGHADWSVPVKDVNGLAKPPSYIGMGFGMDKFLRARFGDRDRVVCFSGLKHGLDRKDLAIGHTPIVGHAYLAAKLLATDVPGSGARGREAAGVWRRVLSGEITVSSLEVIGALTD
jgi:hypothetical protein